VAPDPPDDPGSPSNPDEGNPEGDLPPDPFLPGEGLGGEGQGGTGFEGLQIPGFDMAGLAGMDLSAADLERLTSMLGSSGPLSWEVASQVASVVATEGAEEAAVDPGARTELEELAHAAQTHVVAETGLAATFRAEVRATDRRQWASLHLDALRPVLEALATTFGRALGNAAEVDSPGEGGDLFGNPLPVIAPLLLGVQAGSMIGYLAQHALGRYDLPLPSADEPSLCFVVPNLDAFATAWSLERTDLRFYVAIHEVVHAATRSVGWVRERMVALATEYVSAYEVDPTILEARLGDLDPSDPEAIQQLASRPEDLLGAMRSPAQVEILGRIRALHTVLEGYADCVLERVGARLIPSFAQIHEAMARHRIERGEAERFVEGLLGLDAGQEDFERGVAFGRGVIERASLEGLNRLWEDPANLPTPNELAAPGLWLARLELGDESPHS